MSNQYFVPAGERRIETEVLNSHFIANAAPVFTVEEAKTFIQRIKKEHPNANHHVVAYIIGNESSLISHSTDDGEPSGTAGRPALAVLSGSYFRDIIVVVTRYFGGTKLGTGGLVRAYGDAVREVLAVLPKAKKIATNTLFIRFPYTNYDRVLLILKEFQGAVINTEFDIDIKITISLPVNLFESFNKQIKNITAGKAVVDIIEENKATLFPVE
jgi:uncharacterized YigZ family protein